MGNLVMLNFVETHTRIHRHKCIDSLEKYIERQKKTLDYFKMFIFHLVCSSLVKLKSSGPRSSRIDEYS